MAENVSPNPFEVFKNAYFGFLDQSVEFVKQPVESVKKIMSPAIDAQKEAWNSMSKEQRFAPLKDVATASAGYVELYSKMLSEGFEVAKKSAETWTEVALAWQKVALDTQSNATTAYKNWFNQVKAQ